MRRFFRIFWAAFAGVSLLLCVAAAGVWVRSYFVADVVEWTIGVGRADVPWGRGGKVERFWCAQVSRGTFAVGWARGAPAELFGGDHAGWEYGAERPADAPLSWWGVPGEDQILGLPASGISQRSDGEESDGKCVVHLAYPTALFALAPLAGSIGLARRRRRTLRARAGLCTHCGYDLRASRGRCPECGAVPGSKAGDHG